MSILAMLLNNSPERWLVEPGPAEAKLILPGWLLASAISSWTLFAGTAGFTIRTIGATANNAIGARSFAGSYGRPLVNSVWLTTSGPGAVCSNVYRPGPIWRRNRRPCCRRHRHDF